MADLGSKKSLLVLSMCLALYIILSGILLFYVEHCSTDEAAPKVVEEMRIKCEAAMNRALDAGTVEQTSKAANWSVEDCVQIMDSVQGMSLPDRKRRCMFSPSNYLPWMHRVTFSLLTIGGSRLPSTISGQSLLTGITVLGIFPTIRFFTHTGVIFSKTAEHVILSFELKVLNRSPRMIHLLSRKIVFLQCLVILLYNAMVAKVTSLAFFRTNWTYWESLNFWLLGMTSTGLQIEATESDRFYENGGWRILSIDVGMILGLTLVSGLACSLIQVTHNRHCNASETIRHAFQSQKPEVYFQIKPLKSHL